jgi:hypothetical protein
MPDRLRSPADAGHAHERAAVGGQLAELAELGSRVRTTSLTAWSMTLATSVPGDAHFPTAEKLRVDRSALTGESYPVFKRPADATSAPRCRASSAPSWLSRARAWSRVQRPRSSGRPGMDREVGDIAHLTR